MKNRIIMLVMVLGTILLAGCQKQAAAPKINETPYSDNQFLIGTYVNIRIYDDGKEDVLPLAFKKVKSLGDKVTVNQKGSEIDEVNAQAGIKPVKVTSDVYRLVKKAYQISEESHGGFDMAIGPITQLWHIGFPDARKPSQAEIDAALKLVDYKKVKLNDQKQTIYLEEKGMALDLGAIAKGFIADEVVKLLKKHGVTTAIVDLGGNVYVLGKSPRGKDTPWTVGIQDPNQARNVTVGSVLASNQTLVTSGIYERYLEVDGVKYHHLFNPKTGYPFDNDIAGVTIITKYSIDGDGLSTAVFSMGVQKGLKCVNKQKGVEAIFVTKDDKIYLSKGVPSFELNKESGYTMAK